MNYYFIFIQVIGFIAWLFLLFSYYRKKSNNIIIFQIIGNILFMLHYYLLNAFSGLLLCLCDFVFDTGYVKVNNKLLVYLISIPIRVICGFMFYSSIIDVLPIVASLIEGYSLTCNKKIIVIGGIITYILWFMYDVLVISLSGAISDMIIIVSNIIILINIFKKKEIK